MPKRQTRLAVATGQRSPVQAQSNVIGGSPPVPDRFKTSAIGTRNKRRKNNQGTWNRTHPLSRSNKQFGKFKSRLGKIRKNEEVVRTLFTVDGDDPGGEFTVGSNTRSRYKEGYGYRAKPELDKSPARAGRGSTKSFLLTGEQTRGIEVLTENHKFPYEVADLVTSYMKTPQQRFEEWKQSQVTYKISKGAIDEGVPVTTVYTPVVLMRQGDEGVKLESPDTMRISPPKTTVDEPLDGHYYNFMNKKRPNNNMGLVLQARQKFMEHVSGVSSLF